MKYQWQWDMIWRVDTLSMGPEWNGHDVHKSQSDHPMVSLLSVSYIRAVCVFMFSLCCLCSSNSAYAAEPSSMSSQMAVDKPSRTLVIEDPRPIAEAVISLGEQLHVPITYEDPPFESSDDLIPVFPGSGTLIPRAGQIDFTYHGTDSVKDVLISMLGQYNKIKHGGHFRCAVSNGVYNVIASHYKNRSGEWIEFHSPLDTQVSLDANNRTCADVLKSTFEVVSQADNRFRFEMGTLGALGRIPYPVSDANNSARDILNTILVQCNADLKGQPFFCTWQIRFAPPIKEGEKPLYIFQLRKVSLHTVTPIKMRVTSARPMASAVKLLERRFAVVVTYEDPTYSCSCDVLGIPGTDRMALRGGIINLEWTHKQDSAKTVLSVLMAASIGPKGDQGMYQMEMVDDTHFHIWPIKVRNKDGALVEYQSPWDARLPQTLKGGPVIAVVEKLCAHLSRTGRETITLAAIPRKIIDSLKEHNIASISVENQAVRSVLAKVLWSANKALSWQVVFDPRTQKHELVLHDTRQQAGTATQPVAASAPRDQSNGIGHTR